eukprot:5283943-Pleurochrysis_carterae.AAC.14
MPFYARTEPEHAKTSQRPSLTFPVSKNEIGWQWTETVKKRKCRWGGTNQIPMSAPRPKANTEFARHRSF